MAELAYAMASKSIGLRTVRVRSPPRAPFLQRSRCQFRSIAGVKKPLLVFVAFLVFMRWRHERFESSDAANGYGAYAPVRPAA